MELTFYPAQIKKLLRMRPDVNEERRLGLDEFNTCTGYYDPDETFVLEFKHTQKPGWMRRRYSQELADRKIIPMACFWMNNPILNKTGLAHAIWQDDDSSKLRRRLEQKIERGTLKDWEKKQIMWAMTELCWAMKVSLK